MGEFKSMVRDSERIGLENTPRLKNSETRTFCGGTSLVVQWLRLLLMQGVWVRSLVRALRFLRPHGQNPKTHETGTVL